ncbi:MAG: hypothetical protein PHW31_03605 [Candidatus Pacebacteria bacterium]|nr:hypothetical protein [Candidatus Paceibacterota bacterium]
MTDENLNKIKELIEEFFEKMTFPAGIESQEWEDNLLKVGLVSSEAQVLIGQQGKTLSDIQNILAKILRKQLSQEVFLDLDINNYKSDKKQRFCDLAQEAADEAISSGREKMLFPMAAFERRIIHTELAKRQDVTTESVGEGEERKVVIRPV